MSQRQLDPRQIDATGLPDGKMMITQSGLWVVGDVPESSAELPDPSGLPDGQFLSTVDEAWVAITPSSPGVPVGAGVMVYKGTYVSGGADKGEVYDYLGKTYLCIADTNDAPLIGPESIPTMASLVKGGSAQMSGGYVSLTQGLSQQGTAWDPATFAPPDSIYIEAEVNCVAGADGFQLGVFDAASTDGAVGSGEGFNGIVGAWVTFTTWNNNVIRRRYVTTAGGGNNSADILGHGPGGLHLWRVTFRRTSGQTYSIEVKKNGIIIFGPGSSVVIPNTNLQTAVGAHTGGTGGLHELRSLKTSAAVLGSGWREGLELQT